MSYKRVPSQAMDFLVDEDTGALLVDQGALCAAYRVTIPAASALLTALVDKATGLAVGAGLIPDNLVGIILRPVFATADQINFNLAAAAVAGTSPEWEPAGNARPKRLTPAKARTTQIIASGGASFEATIEIYT